MKIYNVHNEYMDSFDDRKDLCLILPKNVYMKKGLCPLASNKRFMTSILQCLISTINMSDYFISGSYREDMTYKKRTKESSVILNGYISLLNTVFEHNQLVKPESLVRNMCKIYTEYMTKDDANSLTFLRRFLKLLHDSISYSIDLIDNGTVTSKNDEMRKFYKESLKETFGEDYSFIVETFNVCTIKDNKLTFDTCIDLSHLSSYPLDKAFEMYTIEVERSLYNPSDYLIIAFCGDFPLRNLDLTRFILDTEDQYIYDCYAVNFYTSKYYSACKNINDKWYMFDEGVYMINSPPKINSCILFYHRKCYKTPREVSQTSMMFRNKIYQ